MSSPLAHAVSWSLLDGLWVLEEGGPRASHMAPDHRPGITTGTGTRQIAVGTDST
jgi:hypothetical protein